MTRFEVVFAVVEALVLAGYLGHVWYDDGAVVSVETLVSGSLAWCFWFFVVAVGMTAPVVLGVLSALSGRRIFGVASALCVLVGAFCLRYCVLFAAFV